MTLPGLIAGHCSRAIAAGSPDADRRFAGRFRLGNVAPLIEQPLLVVDGDADVVPGVTNGARIAERAPHGEYLLVPGGDHLIGNAPWAWLPSLADWLGTHLRPRPAD